MSGALVLEIIADKEEIKYLVVSCSDVVTEIFELKEGLISGDSLCNRAEQSEYLKQFCIQLNHYFDKAGFWFQFKKETELYEIMGVFDGAGRLLLSFLLRKPELKMSPIRLFDSIVAGTVDAFFLVCERKFISCNFSAAELMGADFPVEIIGKKPSEISPEFQEDGMLSEEKAQLMMDIAKERGSHMFEWVHSRLNGDVFYTEVSLTYLQREGKEYFLTIVRDISEKKLREKELAQSEQRYRMLAENSNDVIWVMNPQMQTLYMSPSIEKQLGYTFEEYTTMPFEKRFAGDHAELMKKLFTENFQKAMQDPSLNSFVYELQYAHKDGGIIWGESSMSLVRDEENRIVKIIGVTRNVNERKTMEEELMLEKERYRAIIEAFDGLLYICSSDYKVEFMNKKLIDRTGYDGTGQMCYKVLHNLDEICPWCVNDRIQNGESAKWEIQSPKDNRWYSVANTPIFRPDGRISKQAMIYDITESKLAELAIRESETKFRALAESSPMAVFIYQGDHLVYANPATEVLSGYSKEEILQMNFYDFIHEDFKPYIMERGVLRQQGEEVPNRYEFKVVDKNGSEKWIDYAGTYIEYEGKGAALGTAYDITERKMTEEALKMSEEKYRSLIELAVDGIIIGDSSGKITDVNQRFLEIGGLKKEQVINKSVGDLFENHILESEPLRFDLLESGQTVVREREFKNSLGYKITVEMHSKKMPDGTYQSFFRDISYRKEAERELAQQKRFLETLMGNLPGIVYRCRNDKDWTMEFISGRCQELTGYPAGDFVKNKKRTFNSIIFEEHRERLWQKWQVVLNKKELFVDEYIIVGADGSKKWVFEQGAGVYDEKGQLEALEGFIMEITDRKKAEDSLVKSQFNYKMLAGYNQLLSRAALVFSMAETMEELENMVVSYYQQLTGAVISVLMFYDPHQKVMFLKHFIAPEQIQKLVVNAFGEEEFMLPSIPVSEESIQRMLHIGVRKTNSIDDIAMGAFSADFLNYIKKSAMIREVVLAIIHRQNTLIGTISGFMQEPSSVPEEILKTYAQLAGFAISRKRTENELIIAKESAEMSDKMKSAFLANISHEVRTPMNAIMGFAELLERPNITEEDRLKYAEIISNAGNQLLSIIDDLIDLAKIESGQMRIISRGFNVNHLMKNLWEMMHHRFENKGLELMLLLETQDSEIILVSDELRLRQILINLLDNACKYTNSGEVVYGYELNQTMIRFYVKDTGVGISAKDAKRIFDRFVRVDETRAGEFSGKGLGLSISKSLAEMLGGQIHLESSLHQGTTFYLDLPLKND
jgi:PAS domain S-box-containing protein